MTPSRPYLIRALYEWIADNGMTPLLLVDAELPGVEVPRQFVKDGKITLNIGMQAVGDLSLENDFVAFSARFSGVSQVVRIPPTAVLAIYARENNQGMMFSPEDGDGDPPPATDDSRPSTGPALRVVK